MRGITGVFLLALFVACTDPAGVTVNDPSATGVWREARAVPISYTNGLAASGKPDSVTYTLRINDQQGFVHGTWTIAGDTTQPTDPWEAVVTGDHREGRLLVEYHDPAIGQCRLAGPIEPDGYGFIAEQRCAGNQWEVSDTFHLWPAPIGGIHGTVDVERRGIGGVLVSLGDGDTTRTGSSGYYIFPNVRAGTYTVAISGYPDDVQFPTTSKAVEISSIDIVNVSFAGNYIRTSSVMGSVTVENQGLSGISVHLTGQDSAVASTRAIATTGNGGGYAFTGMRRGTYEIEITGFDTTAVKFAETSRTVTVGIGESKIISFDGTKR